MNINILLGVAAVAYGIYTAIARVTKPEAFGKLEAMRKQWGEGPGTAMHVISYTVMPLLVGAIFIYTGLKAR